MGIPGFPCAALAGCAACKRVANVVLKETMRPKYTEWQGPTLFVAHAKGDAKGRGGVTLTKDVSAGGI